METSVYMSGSGHVPIKMCLPKWAEGRLGSGMRVVNPWLNTLQCWACALRSKPKLLPGVWGACFGPSHVSYTFSPLHRTPDTLLCFWPSDLPYFLSLWEIQAIVQVVPLALNCLPILSLLLHTLTATLLSRSQFDLVYHISLNTYAYVRTLDSKWQKWNFVKLRNWYDIVWLK